MAKLRFDIENDNFDFYFSNIIENIGEQEKSQLPKELLYKMFYKGGKFNSTSTSKLPFLAKLYILFKLQKKRWILLIEDENEGVNIDDFFNFKSRLKRREYDLDNAGKLISEGFFALSDKELSETFGRLNNLSVSPAYNYLVKTKNTEVSKISEYKNQLGYITKVFSFYESNKKKWVMATGLSMPEFLVLVYIYDKGEVVSAQLHKSIYKYAYNSSSTQIKLAFGTLQKKGYIDKIGVNKGVKIKITAAGIDIMNHIFNKYVLNP